MTAINITEKQLDILVNGSIEDSFSQRANSANYDISITDDTTFSWNNDIVYDTSISDGTVLDTLSSKNLYYLEGEQFGTTGTDIEVYVGGNLVLTIPEAFTGTHSTTFIGYANEDITVQLNGPASSIASGDWTMQRDSCANSTFVTDKGGAERLLVEGLTVNSITQS